MVKQQDEILNTSKAFLELVAELFPVTNAWLYGSYAKGKQNKWSDIDIAICSPDFEHIPRPIAIKLLSKLARKIDYAIEPYPLRPKECHDQVIGTMAFEIISSGILIK
jgi:predicted nucleotidyltransferase